MGKTTWRWPETALLEDIDNSEKGRQFVEEARQDVAGWTTRATNHYVTLYLAKFQSICFTKENEAELACRQARSPNAKLEPWPEESEEDRENRVKNIRKRIKSYIQRRSPNNARNSKGAAKNLSAPRNVSAPNLTIVPTEKVSFTSGFQQFKKSKHPSKPTVPHTSNGKIDFATYNAQVADAYQELSDREQFERTAHEINAERLAALKNFPSRATREQKAQVFPEWIEEVCSVIGLEVGWIGWFPIGGLDEHNNIRAMFPTIGSLHGITFEEWLARKMKWSPGRLRNEFYSFLQEVFDPAEPDGILVLPETSAPSHPERASTSNRSSPSDGPSTPSRGSSSTSSCASAPFPAPPGIHVSSRSAPSPASDTAPDNAVTAVAPLDIEPKPPGHDLPLSTGNPGNVVDLSTDIREAADRLDLLEGFDDDAAAAAAAAAEVGSTHDRVSEGTPADSRALRYA
ncbi:hypothetical protein TRAPUB_5538 [Trametes pubescens]|uniref:Uncharacterized protein n=1 Tax=Trametes pubescens TaxID=154538 RepID=A0A1M2V882_TRAPU|nr:hypothetical protein TRAPUB_5538 [Trametes pubescens]